MTRKSSVSSTQLNPLWRINDIRTRKQIYSCKNFSIAFLSSGSVIVTAKNSDVIVARTEIVATGISLKEFVYCTCSVRVLPKKEKINSCVAYRYSGTCSRIDVETLKNGVVRVYVFPVSSLKLSDLTKEDAQLYSITSKAGSYCSSEVTFAACLAPEK